MYNTGYIVCEKCNDHMFVGMESFLLDGRIFCRKCFEEQQKNKCGSIITLDDIKYMGVIKNDK